MSALTLEYTGNKNRETLSQPKASHGVMTRLLHQENDVKEAVSSQPSVTWYKSTNQKIGIRTLCES